MKSRTIQDLRFSHVFSIVSTDFTHVLLSRYSTLFMYHKVSIEFFAIIIVKYATNKAFLIMLNKLPSVHEIT